MDGLTNIKQVQKMRQTTRAGRKTGNPVGRPKKDNALSEHIQFRTTYERMIFVQSLDNKSSWFNAIIDAAMKL